MTCRATRAPYTPKPSEAKILCEHKYGGDRKNSISASEPQWWGVRRGGGGRGSERSGLMGAAAALMR